MNPRYQIFISSTFRDLRKERQAVLDAILELGHFPSGMEVFPAADATPWSIIEAIIAESDYYVLIIGGIYGSTDESGISYTEREYDLAVSRGIPVLAFLHSDPSRIPVGMSELDPDARARLAAFRTKVEIHHCKYWSSADELKSQVVVSLVHAIRVNPRIGWIRSDTGDTADTLKKLTTVLEENALLKTELKSFRESLAVRTNIGGDLASGEDTVDLHFRSTPHKNWKAVISWDELFQLVGPILLSDREETELFAELSTAVATVTARTLPPPDNAISAAWAELVDDDFYRVIYQFMALDYIEPVTIIRQTEVFDKATTLHIRGFRLTRKGSLAFGRLRAVRKVG